MKIVLLLLLCIKVTFPQISEIKDFKLPSSHLNVDAHSISSNSSNMLFMFWSESGKILFSKSSDYGISWNEKKLIHQAYSSSVQLNDLASIVTTSGRLIVFFKDPNVYSKYSDDEGNTWSTETILQTGTTLINRRYATSLFPVINDTNSVYLMYTRSHISSPGIFRVESSDNGITWGPEKRLVTDPSVTSPSLVQLEEGKQIMYYIKKDTLANNIYSVVSLDYGATWSPPGEIIYSTPGVIKGAKSTRIDINTIYLIYEAELPTPFSGFINNELEFIKSTNSGLSWSTANKFTSYKGSDTQPQISMIANKPIVSFLSGRDSTTNNNNRIWIGIPGESVDSYTPPKIFHVNAFLDNMPNQKVFVRALIDDDNKIDSVILEYEFNGKFQSPLIMNDDGINGDSIANDNVYSTEIPSTLNSGDNVVLYVKAVDSLLNQTTEYGGVIVIPSGIPVSSYFLDVNRLKMPINNSGVLADVLINGRDGALYDDKVVMFSSGFFLSGKSNSTMWANAVASASRIQDYSPGLLGAPGTDPRNQIYVVSVYDAPFSSSWLDWKVAVTLGADFYDGNNDGIYDPVDLNGNNVWDPNEDKPDIIGDISAYTVYNDAVPSILRRFSEVEPQGIEIGQTIFGYVDSSLNTLNNTLFIRYKILNKGTTIPIMDSVYFSLWTDPDVGDAYDDLVASDTLLDAGFSYHNASDSEFGLAAPTVGVALLQGPFDYVPGITFIDNNSNGIYDEGTDTPLDTAYSMKGSLLGMKTYPGAMNRKMTAFMHYLQSHPTIGDPNTHYEARNFMLGLDKYGNPIDPCNWPFGSVVGGVNCSSIPPQFLYSGNPGSNIGWICNTKTDQRFLLTTGPFKLKVNEPVEIIGAFIVGRKENPLSSFYEARRITSYARSLHKSNFGQFPLGLDGEASTSVNMYELSQNYPNPFNPITTIHYSIPQTGLVTIKIFDILGKEITTLVNEEKKSGNHKIEFNGSKLSSGIYFYQIKSGSFTATKKLVLLK
ncbi:MAG: T9SS type A sorting domain-containing protein [Ignavibacteria bacterium]|nr:T9SS type A sorting domain-containing protein [Ignavibacteria bacterium]